MKKNIRPFGNILASLAMLFSTLIAVPSTASAASTTTLPDSPAFHQQTSSSGISIEPRANALINPGQSETGSLVVGNLDSTAPLDLTLRVIDFTYTGDTGEPKLYTGSQAQTPWSLKPYIKLPSEVTLGAGQSATIKYTVSIPAGLGAGSYYSAIEYQSGLGDEGNVGLSSSGVTLVFVNVSGTDHEKLTLEKFGSYLSTNSGQFGKFTSFSTTMPTMMAFKLKNSGNTAEAPAGTIVMKYFGHKSRTISSINPDSLLSLIGQTRLFTSCIKNQTALGKFAPNGTSSSATTCIDPHLTPGHYSATLEAYYGQNGNETQEVIGTAGFWYIPTWLLIVLIIILILLIYTIWKIYKKIRRILGKETNKKQSTAHTYSNRLQSKKGSKLKIRRKN
jgi:hypothetical protein